LLAVLLSVIAISFTGAIMPGPMFAVTLAKSYRSPWAGVQIALGHAVVEVPLILLIYFGFARFFEHAIVQLVLSIVGGAVIVYLGFDMFRSRKKIVSEGKDLPFNSFVDGIVMTGLNPFFLLWWATIGSMLLARIVEYGLGGVGIFIVAHWMCDLVWLGFVSIAIYKSRSISSTIFHQWVFILSSLILGVFGVWFVVSGIMKVV
jgi:threonine/homoserine/homoserine lactone efflux protein